MQECERVHRANVKRSNRACRFALGTSPRQLLYAVAATSAVTLEQLPLMCPDIGKPGKCQAKHTRLVAHLAVATKFTDDRHVALVFNKPDNQIAPRSAGKEAQIDSMLLRQRTDAWLAALVEAAGNSLARHVSCSSYVLQAAARHELRAVLGHSRLAYQFPPFQQDPQVSLVINTDYGDPATGLMLHALRNIPCLDLRFTVGPTQQHSWLQKLPAGRIQCFGVSGCDAHEPGILTALCGALQSLKELKSFQLGAMSKGKTDARPFDASSVQQLQRSLLKRGRIVAVSFANKTVQDQVCSRALLLLALFSAAWQQC
jgi:hypothetical protein